MIEDLETVPLVNPDPETQTVIDTPKTEGELEKETPVAGFIYLGFVLNMCINYVLQEVNYFIAVFGSSFGGRASLSFGVSNLIGQLIMVYLPPDLSFSGRICISSFLMGCSLIAIPVMTFLSIPFNELVVYGLIVVVGVSNAVLGSALFGITGFCSEKIRKFFNMGVCLSGILVWPLMLIVDTILVRAFDMNPVRAERDVPSRMEMVSCLLVLSIGAACFFATIPFYLFGLSNSHAVTSALAKIKEKMKAKKSMNFWQILVATMPMAVAAWNVMFLTFLVLPDQMMQWVPSFNYKFELKTYRDLVIFTFNLFDVLGRVCAVNWITLKDWQVLGGSLARWVLLPFFFLAAANFSVVGSDIFKFLLQASFAASYGIVITWAMTLGPSQQGIPPDNADTAGMIMSIMLVIGLLMGSLVSTLIRDLPNNWLRFSPARINCRVDPALHTLICEAPTTATTAI